VVPISAQTLQGRDSRGAEGFEEGDVRLDGGGIRDGRVQQNLAEALHSGEIRREAIRQGFGLRIDADAKHRAGLTRAGSQTLEVGVHESEG